MRLSKLKQFKWEEDQIISDTWHDNELCFEVFIKDKNPLRKLFSSYGLDAVLLNSQLYSEEEDAYFWEYDEQKAIGKGVKFLEQLIVASENYIDQVKKIIAEIEHVTEIDRHVFKKIKSGLKITWYIFLCDLGKPLSPYIDEWLKSKGLNDYQIEKTKNYCFNFKHPFGFQKEESELEKIYNEYKKQYGQKKEVFEQLDDRILDLLSRHAEKFGYLTYLTLDSKPYTALDFFTKMSHLGLRKKERIKKLPESIEKLLKKEDLRFLHLVHRHIYLDNYAADLCSKLDFLLTGYLSKKFKISYKDLTWYSFTELERLALYCKKLRVKELSVRKKFRAMIQIGGHIEMFYGKKHFQKIGHAIKEQRYLKNANNAITGLTASRGFVRGVVKIVRRTSDIDKVKRGDILVATTTRPDLMLAIQKCSAIVTDSGGLTSHAAIVSREFNIPCIVGTNIATQVLHDGSLVEVDAYKGVVSIIQ